MPVYHDVLPVGPLGSSGQPRGWPTHLIPLEAISHISLHRPPEMALSADLAAILSQAKCPEEFITWLTDQG
eukprot:14819167-Heterocapsa_arctica.AAC.1